MHRYDHTHDLGPVGAAITNGRGAPLAGQLFVLAPSVLSVTLMVYVGYYAIGLGVNRLFAGRRKRWFDRITGSIFLAFTVGPGSVDMHKTQWIDRAI